MYSAVVGLIYHHINNYVGVKINMVHAHNY